MGGARPQLRSRIPMEQQTAAKEEEEQLHAHTVHLSSYGTASDKKTDELLDGRNDYNVEGQTKLRSLNANATYAALFLAFDFVIFTAAKKENLDNQPHWRKLTTLYAALLSVTAHLNCVITAVIYNYVLASLEQLPRDGQAFCALKKFNSTGIPLGLVHSGLMLRVHYSEFHADVAAVFLLLVAIIISFAGVSAFRYVRSYHRADGSHGSK